jgi:hypothetical protein
MNDQVLVGDVFESKNLTNELQYFIITELINNYKGYGKYLHSTNQITWYSGAMLHKPTWRLVKRYGKTICEHCHER